MHRKHAVVGHQQQIYKEWYAAESKVLVCTFINCFIILRYLRLDTGHEGLFAYFYSCIFMHLCACVFDFLIWLLLSCRAMTSWIFVHFFLCICVFFLLCICVFRNFVFVYTFMYCVFVYLLCPCDYRCHAESCQPADWAKLTSSHC